jgi:hypothetical protein
LPSKRHTSILSALVCALAAVGAPALARAPRAHIARVGDCQVLPADNPLNQDISRAPVDPRSDAYIASIGASAHLFADFGFTPSYGIPYVVVGARQPKVPIKFTEWGKESNPGPYPVPADAPVERAELTWGDHHVLVVQEGSCKLYELYKAHRNGRGWDAGSGAVFDLRSNALRPEGWTSADAAGLPIFPLIARYQEVADGQITHALRVTVGHTQRAYIHPATHFSSESTDPNLPPMGLRLRLKASFSLAGFHGQALVILRALKRYGLIVADEGSPWFLSGAPSSHWRKRDLAQLERVPGSAFEAVSTGPLRRRG